jgi:hydrogenase maturation protease
MKRIICIGNRYIDEDSAGPRVYDRLSRKKDRPPDLEIIDGGLGGINLIPFFEFCKKVVLVDQMKHSDPSERIVVLDAADVSATAEDHFGHAAGLGYLLRVLPKACEGNLPGISIVGICGNPDDETIQEAAELALTMVD